ncbi:DUF1643 domain-containing protein [Pseudomonas sp. AA27]|uniref:DUF1643 domain-containing protein n=1 Tax=unclassified Pseudomonas TaxID=196821 RepID=UPI001F383DE1|nr:DUF1643 domain-containing protein [Pseudomonas sp. AA27]MCF1487527.1 DUF1643 domain-containing protein [Pseudomonas sp. AA27]
MSAVISSCGLYRYRLEREVQAEGKVFAFFGINPSTADATLDDATVRKWRGFTQRNGGRRFIVGNVFCYRATDPRDVGFSNDRRTYINGLPTPSHHLDNLEHIRQIITDADVLVPCWGRTTKVTAAIRYCFAEVLGLLNASGKPVLHFGVTASGDPKHPLMLGYDTPLIPWGQP